VTVVVGIDEAGLGPVMGPLVVTATAFVLPESMTMPDLWEVLSPGVTRRPSTRGGVAVADSKLLYHGLRSPGGLARLERGVLAFLWAANATPCSLDELLSTCSVSGWSGRTACPWYHQAALELPVDVDVEGVVEAGIRIAEVMGARGVSLTRVDAEVVLAGELNQLLATSDSKAEVHLSVTARLLRRLSAAYPDDDLVLWVDRHGARKHYLGPLQEVFGEAWVWVGEESRELSSYRIEDGSHHIDITFAVGCEQRQLPVALASMVSKYLRELHLRLFNHYWQKHVPGIAPTAGYAVDGRRFYGEIKGSLGKLGIDPALVWRTR